MLDHVYLPLGTKNLYKFYVRGDDIYNFKDLKIL